MALWLVFDYAIEHFPRLSRWVGGSCQTWTTEEMGWEGTTDYIVLACTPHNTTSRLHVYSNHP